MSPNGQASLVLVTDAERPQALAVARSLGRAGHRVCVASHEERCPAFRSRFAAERLLVPAPWIEPSLFVDAVRERARKGDVSLVIPTTELSLLPLARERESLEPFTKLAAPADGALHAAIDKAETVALADRVGVPAPATRIISCPADLDAARTALRLPVVLKARRSVDLTADGGERMGPGAFYARTWDDARRHVQAAGSELLCQEAVVGEGVGIEGLYQEGRPIVLFQHVRIRELPLSGGGSTCRRSEPLDPTFALYAERIFGALGWTGVAMLELKRGSFGAALIEVNGRFWGSLPLAIAAGVDFPRLLADLLIDGVVTSPPSYSIGVTRTDLLRDIEWAKAVLRRSDAGLARRPGRRQALDPVRDLLLGRALPDLWAPDDPRALWIETLEVARSLGRPVRRWLDSRRGALRRQSRNRALKKGA